MKPSGERHGPSFISSFESQRTSRSFNFQHCTLGNVSCCNGRTKKKNAYHFNIKQNSTLICFQQIAIVVRYSNLALGPDYDNIGGLDYIFAGIWTGFFYGVAGIIGICASYERKRSQ